jgi:precorrin-3B synthase
MPSGDGWLARVKPRHPALTAATLRLIGAAARRHGSGVIDLTSRANLQIRGLTPASATGLAAEMEAAGLALADPAAERRRNVIVSPLVGIDPACDRDTQAVAEALDAALAQADDLAGLPGKFLFAVDGGGLLPLGDGGADIVLRAHAGGWRVGIAGAHCVRGDAIEAVAIALALARACLERAPARTRMLRAQCGEAALFAGAGFAAMAPMPGAAPVTPIGAHMGSCVGIGLPFGALDAAFVADLAERFGDGTLRVTPWRAVLLPGVARPEALRAASGNLILDDTDRRRRVIACPGQPGCASAHADIRADAAMLAASLPDGIGQVHLSGCAKGCAHPNPAAITLVATPQGYAMVRHGHARDTPIASGLSAHDAAALCASQDRTAA